MLQMKINVTYTTVKYEDAMYGGDILQIRAVRRCACALATEIRICTAALRSCTFFNFNDENVVNEHLTPVHLRTI